MNVVFWFLLDIFVLNSADVITSNSALELIGAEHSVFTSSSLGSPDPQFDLDVVFEGPKLPLISVLASIVGLLVHFGLQDFYGSIDAVIWRLKEYNKIQIVILPDVGGPSVERRFIIWGIGQAAGLMINSQRFQTAMITLKWRGESVGRLLLKEWPPFFDMDGLRSINMTQLPRQHTESSAANIMTRPTEPLRNILSTDNMLGEQFDITASLNGSALNPVDVYRMVIAILVDAAEQAATKRINGYVSPANIAAVEVMIQVPSPAPTRPPYFENQWLMRLIATIPEYMIKQGVFMEGDFLVKIGRSTVANAFVRKKMPVVASGFLNGSVS